MNIVGMAERLDVNLISLFTSDCLLGWTLALILTA